MLAEGPHGQMINNTTMGCPFALNGRFVSYENDDRLREIREYQ